MSDTVLTFSDRLGFSKLFQDFIYKPERMTPFFGAAPDEERINAISGGARFRSEAVEILMRQNREWQAPPAVIESISKLENSRSVAVVAGQQACLLGGPYLVLLKALAAIKLARELEKKNGVPVVPIFWIAADDHDYREVSFVDVFDTSGRLSRLEIDTGNKQAGAPIGALSYDESVARECERLQSILPVNDFMDEAWSPLGAIYKPGENIADCFAKYVLSLVGHLGLAIFNPYDRDFKKHTAPIMQRIISRHGDIKKTLKETEVALTDAGYHIQVQKAPTAAHLFYHTPDRTPIHSDGGAFRAGESAFTEKELVDRIASNPIEFSPDVLTRPLLQSYFFPTAAVIGGPAEIAYYAQLYPLYNMFDLAPPAIRARQSMTLVETRYQKLLDRHQIDLVDLAGDVEEVINQILKESFPDDLDEYLTAFALNSKNEISRLRERLANVDPDLATIADQAGDKIDFQIKKMTQKLFAVHKKKHSTERERIYRLHENLIPNRGLAERSIAPVYPISRYGRGIIDYIYDKMNLDETGHRLLMLSEYHG